MIKLTIIGAGSAVFTKNIVTDLLHIKEFKNMEIALVDIDQNRLKLSHELLNVISEKLDANIKIKSFKFRLIIIFKIKTFIIATFTIFIYFRYFYISIKYWAVKLFCNKTFS